MLLSLGFLALTVAAMVPALSAVVDGEPGASDLLGQVVQQSASQALLSLASVPGGALVLLAGRRMRELRSIRLVQLGCLLCFVPCCTNLCCCGGWMVAAWVLLTLRDARVRAAFAAEP